MFILLLKPVTEAGGLFQPQHPGIAAVTELKLFNSHLPAL
jgi:hypothetical protein